MAKLDEKYGVPNFVAEDVGPSIDREVRRLVRRLRLERDARDGVVPTWPLGDEHRPQALEQPDARQGPRPNRNLPHEEERSPTAGGRAELGR
jgi:hypothetical protein